VIAKDLAPAARRILRAEGPDDGPQDDAVVPVFATCALARWSSAIASASGRGQVTPSMVVTLWVPSGRATLTVYVKRSQQGLAGK
jgi:hypothetical protein